MPHTTRVFCSSSTGHPADEFVHLSGSSLYHRQVLGAISRFSLPDSITLYLKMLNFLFTLYFLML
jgi:hypothetical protein